MKNENGGDLKGYFADETGLINKFSEKLSYIKKCDSSNFSDVGCWYSNGLKQLNGVDYTGFNSAGQSALILNNGTYLRFIGTDLATCNNHNFYVTEPDGGGLCGYLLVDVNGAVKPPNTIGKDAFIVYILKGNTAPGGTLDDRAGSCTSSSLGWSCAAEYLYE